MITRQSPPHTPGTMTSLERCAVCPSCNGTVTFTHIGDQHWPEHIVRARGIAPVMSLWVCGQCDTTVTGATLDDQQATASR